MARSYDVWIPPKQRPIKAGPAATRRYQWRKEFGPVPLKVGRLVCALYHNSNRDACLLPHRCECAVGKTYWI